MPLSPEEQEQLEAIEHYLSLDDPDFVRRLRSGSRGTSVKARHVWLSLVLLMGIMVLPVGLAAKFLAVAVVGFILAAVGAYGVLGNSLFQNPQVAAREESREKPERR
ncbi:DUF3040 domain-containing protein [Arthrobacter sp. NPDC055138]